MKKIFTILFIFLALVSFFISIPVLAQEGEVEDLDGSMIWKGVTCNQQGEGPCTFCEMLIVVSNITDFLTKIAFTIAVAMSFTGGMMMILSAGDEKRFTQGKSLITNAVIGIAIISVSWIIVNTLFHVMTGDNNFIWSKVTC
jgi:hypothetical protein